MHLDGEIERFVLRWWRKYEAEDQNEVFDRFFAVWLVLIALARADENENTGERFLGEMDQLKRFFGRNWKEIAGCIQGSWALLEQLARRRGDDHGNSMIDAPTRQRDRIRALAQMIQRGGPLGQSEITTLACVFTIIRNNLFHARKIYDGRSDRDLLLLVTPIIAQVVKGFLPPSRDG